MTGPGGAARPTRRELIGAAGAAAVAWTGETSAEAASPVAGGGRMITMPGAACAVPTPLLLAIDDAAIPLRHNLCLHITRPRVRAEPVLGPEAANPNAPDALAAHFYGTVLHDGDRFRMYYYPCSAGPNPDWPPEARAQLETYRDNLFQGPLCYAESDDGIAWRKPHLRQLRFKGSLDNNALGLPDAMTAGATVIMDAADPDPARRYKLVYVYYEWKKSGFLIAMRTATSADGIAWKVGPPRPVHDWIEQASFYRHGGLYVVNAQYVGPSERLGLGGAPIGRQGFAYVSPDFDHWLQESARSFALAEPQHDGKRALAGEYDQAHLGIGAASLGNVAVGLYARWHHRKKFSDIDADLGLVVSSDGLAFREVEKDHIWLAARESPVTQLPGQHMSTVLCQANGILDVGDETRIYHGRWRNAPSDADYYAEVALATIPRGRWGALALAPDMAEGSLWTAPMTLPRGRFAVTANVDGAAGLRVEVADARFAFDPGLSGDRAGVIAADGLDAPVRWRRAGQAVSGGRTIRLRVRFARAPGVEPRLYALRIAAVA